MKTILQKCQVVENKAILQKCQVAETFFFSKASIYMMLFQLKTTNEHLSNMGFAQSLLLKFSSPKWMIPQAI